ncbi:MAG TPA: hypothetical protein VG435_09570 [Acidimicrobiales bacterium]|jgi:hypothetical protein|nr:hypothetical protein [Acidimicrobiales bacterium]
MADLDRHLYDLIRDRAGRIDIPGGDLDSVSAQGRSRRRRARVTASVVAAAVAGSATGIVVTSIGGSHHPTRVVDPATSGSATPAAQLNWHQQSATDGLLMEYQLTAPTGGAQYAVSTAPGATPTSGPPAQALYRSTNGADWQAVPAPSNLSVADLAASGNSIYDVGTGPATSGSPAAGVAVSTDGGASWTDAPLPVSMTAPDGALTVDDQVLRVAAGPGGVVVGVGAAADLDLSRVVAGATSQTAWAPTVQGIDILGAARGDVCPAGSSSSGPATPYTTGSGLTAAQQAQARRKLAASPTTVAGAHAPGGEVSSVSCVGSDGTVVSSVPPAQAYQVTSSYTWAQLGISDDAALALQGDAIFFHSSDGHTFTRVDSQPGLQSDGLTLIADGRGFAAASSTNPDQSVVYQSADGLSWTPTSLLPSAVSWVQNLGVVGGNLTAVGSVGTGSQVFQLVGGQWVKTAQSDSSASASFGPLGLALASSDSSGNVTVQFSPDGSQWQSHSFDQPAGAVEAGIMVAVGADRVAVTVTPNQVGQPATVLVGSPLA